MSNPNLPIELTTELDEDVYTYRDLLDPILDLADIEIQQIADALYCLARQEELPNKFHDFLDFPRQKESHPPLTFIVQGPGATEVELTLTRLKESESQLRILIQNQLKSG